MASSNKLKRLLHRMGRQKLVGQEDTHTSLQRCLSTAQLVTMGLGATIGVGIYVLLGVAIRDYAGPAVLISFLVAGLICLTNAVVFAEFGARIPHTGAAYTYSYKAVGELAAFLTGWMYLLSATCSGATGARAWSGFVDSLFNNSIQAFFDNKVGQLDLGPPFARSLDWVAFTFYLVVTLVVSLNVNCSSIINMTLAILTTGVLIFVTFAGVIIGDVKRLGDAEGGFSPFGVQGIIVGASAAFYAFNGFDNICIAAEEAKDPARSVPRAILMEMAIVTVVYCGAAVGTLSLIPYTDIDLRAPIPSAFAYQGVTWARYLVTIGPVIAITNLNILCLFALSRTAYRMAKDGLLFSKFSYINPRTKTPLFGIIVFGILMSVASLLLELKDLVRFAVLCMLFQYIVLAPALIALRASDPLSGIKNLSNEQEVSPFELEIEVPPPSENATAFSDGEETSIPNDGKRNGAKSAKKEDSAMRNLNRVPPGEIENNRDESKTSAYISDPLKSSGREAEDGEVSSGFVTPPDGSPTSREGGLPVDLINITPEKLTGNDVIPDFVEGSRTGNNHSANDETTPYATGINQTNISESQDNVASGGTQNLLQESKPGNRNRSLDRNQRGRKPGPKSARAGFQKSQPLTFQQTESSSANWPEKKRGVLAEFFKLLTTTRTVLLLVACLSGLAAQTGLGFKDLVKGSPTAVASTLILTVLVVFFCEVLRKRCHVGDYNGFKVPLMPYVPALSCFLNMILLVSAADLMGLIEFAVLISIGFVLYVIMVMTEKTQSSDVRPESTVTSEEGYALLGYGDDEDSDDSL